MALLVSTSYCCGMMAPCRASLSAFASACMCAPWGRARAVVIFDFGDDFSVICLGSSHRSIIACAFCVCVIVCNVTFICFSDYRRLNAHGCFVRRLWDFRSRQALFFAVVIALCSRCSLSVRVCVADSLLSPFRLQMSGVSASCSLICTSPFFVFGSLELASRVGCHRAPTYSLVRRRASA